MASTSIATSHWKAHQSSLTKKLLPYVIYAIIPIVLFRFYFYPSPPLNPTDGDDHFSGYSSIAISKSLSSQGNDGHIVTLPNKGSEIESGSEDLPEEASVLPKEKEKEKEDHILHPEPFTEKEAENGKLPEGKSNEISSTCDYSYGEWVQDSKGPLYNGTSCGTIKDGQNCMSHGRPDKDYLYWRWEPKQCKLPRFDPQAFLRILQDKHLAFVGDSMARNQLESLLCLLSSVSPPKLVYSNGEDNKFRRWHFASHNVNVSVYWSPFLVKGMEKTDDGKLNYNKLYFDSADERWASELDTIDMIVLSVGHWYLHPAVYFDGDTMLGCHFAEGVNCTEIGFFDVFGKAFNTSLKAIVERKGLKGKNIDVIVTTFSPHHFEGDWDKLGACPKTKPYKEAEKALEGMDADMRKVEVDEVVKAKAALDANSISNVNLAALDVTKLAMLRPDGHPGPYMYPNPFADGIKDRVQNDCVHWCLPGPIDTWNEIMFDVMKRWHV